MVSSSLTQFVAIVPISFKVTSCSPGVNLHIRKRKYYPCDEIAAKNYHVVKFPSSKWQNVGRYADISVLVRHEYTSGVIMARIDRFMYIDHLISLLTLNVFWKRNIVHLCIIITNTLYDIFITIPLQ